MSASNRVGDDTTDFVMQVQRKPLNVNRYATKKTIAQGMLDVALLTANASQLRYVLQVGDRHEFYTLMVVLISLSIALQSTQWLMNVVLTILDARDTFGGYTLQRDILNYITLTLSFCTVVLDTTWSGFGLDRYPRLQADNAP